jgi:nucleoside-diphosphate-sugar epimerase/pimeloyl-ACP methyl ester carboxylesterase
MITGATGFIGSHFLLALHERHDCVVTVLLRGRTLGAAVTKLKNALRTAAESYRSIRDHAGAASEARIIMGDVSLPGCGVAPEWSTQVAAQGGIAEVWHLAASLSFEEKNRKTIAACNIEGAANAVALASSAGATRFIYVSTAYSVGKHVGLVPETLHDVEGPFNNLYEQSKCAAEHAVTRLCAEKGLELIILRPSIVVGPSETKLPGGSRTGIYGFIREMLRLSEALRNWEGGVRIGTNPEIVLNLIPVDYVVRDMLHIIDVGFAVAPIVHLTSSSGPPVGECIRVVTESLGLHRIEFDQGPKDDYSPLERLLDRRMTFYGSYLVGQKEFERSLPTRWDVAVHDVHGYAAEGIRDARRESELGAFVCGRGGSAVICANAMGMPAGFWTRLASRLEAQHRVLTWETRGVPSAWDGFFDHDSSVDTHVRDLLAVMDAHGIAQAHVMGWCSGALVALKAAYRAPSRILSVVLLNGSFSLDDQHPQTQFERNMRLVMPRIAASRRTAELYYRTIYQPQRRNRHTLQRAEAEAAQRTTELIMSSEPDLIHLTSVPYDSIDALHRYGRLISEVLKDNAAQWAGRVDRPVFAISGEQDATEHPAGTRFVASLLQNARLRIYPDMDHFGLFNSPQLGDDIAAFLAEHSQAAPSRALVASATLQDG